MKFLPIKPPTLPQPKFIPFPFEFDSIMRYLLLPTLVTLLCLCVMEISADGRASSAHLPKFDQAKEKAKIKHLLEFCPGTKGKEAIEKADTRKKTPKASTGEKRPAKNPEEVLGHCCHFIVEQLNEQKKHHKTDEAAAKTATEKELLEKMEKGQKQAKEHMDAHAHKTGSADTDEEPTKHALSEDEKQMMEGMACMPVECTGAAHCEANEKSIANHKTLKQHIKKILKKGKTAEGKASKVVQHGAHKVAV